MSYKNETSFFELLLLSIVLVLAFVVFFLPGCAHKSPDTMTIEERLEPYRYLIRDTLLRDERVDVFVGEQYHNLNNQQRLNFAQDLSWAYYPREVIVRDVSTNRLLMSVSEDRHIQLIWQESSLLLAQVDTNKPDTPGPQYPPQVKDILEKGGVGPVQEPGAGVGDADSVGVQAPNLGDTQTPEKDKPKKDKPTGVDKVKEIQ